jgi:hypothetical protein
MLLGGFSTIAIAPPGELHASCGRASSWHVLPSKKM